ncbi:PspC domain-containing protein [bacterium]|nr:PspC domain-containing protein [bacterium]
MEVEGKVSSKRLYRSMDNRLLAGVCSGLGEYFEIDPVIIRIIWIILGIGGYGILLYMLFWLIIPRKP